MPWLEVPEWRAWESYAAPMPDEHPDSTPTDDAALAPLPGEGLVITGSIDIRLEDGDQLAAGTPASVHTELDQLPETPDADVIPFPDPDATPADPDQAAADADAGPIEGPELPDGARFPVESVPERVDDPRFIGSAVDTSGHPSYADPDAYARKITTPRSERLRGG